MLSPDYEAFFTAWRGVAVIVSVIAYLAFAVIYGVLYQWRKRRAGRAVFFAFVSLVLVSFISFLATWVGEDYWLRPFWSALGWTGVAFSAIYLIYALLRNWNQRERIEIEPRNPPTGESPKHPVD
jgi:hypothetical protein